jgi:hypothetical protein
MRRGSGSVGGYGTHPTSAATSVVPVVAWDGCRSVALFTNGSGPECGVL